MEVLRLKTGKNEITSLTDKKSNRVEMTKIVELYQTPFKNELELEPTEQATFFIS